VAGSLLFILVVGAGTGPPSWLVAAATLAAAAVFRPARRRIQTAVDRRFNRRKYNAATTIQAFSTRLREQIDLDTRSTELLAVVDQTMEPTQVSLWLRPSPDGSSGTARREARPTPGPTEHHLRPASRLVKRQSTSVTDYQYRGGCVKPPPTGQAVHRSRVSLRVVLNLRRGRMFSGER
jgi:hypothetical protein